MGGPRPTLHLQAQHDVLLGGAPWQQKVLLEHIADTRRHAADFPAVPQHRTPAGLQEAAQQVEQRGLAASGRPDDAHDLAAVQAERDRPDDLQFPARIRHERLAEMLRLERDFLLPRARDPHRQLAAALLAKLLSTIWSNVVVPLMFFR